MRRETYGATTPFFLLLLCFLFSFTHAHEFSFGDRVPMFANVVFPKDSPLETYPFYYLPFPKPEYEERPWWSLSSALQGDALNSIDIHPTFLENTNWRPIGIAKLNTKTDVKHFKRIIAKNYVAEALVDGLPVYFPLVDEHGRLNTGFHIKLGYNGGNVVTASVAADPLRVKDPSLIEIGAVSQFFCAITWEERTDVSYFDRMDLYSQDTAFEHVKALHYLSVGWSAIVFLIAVVTFFFTRGVLNSAVSRYSHDPLDLAPASGDGWRAIRNDVGRPPAYRSVLAAFLGAGAHVAVMVVTALVFMAFVSLETTERSNGIVKGVIVLSFLLGCPIAGFVSARKYRAMKGTRWLLNVFLTILVLPFPVAVVFFTTNTMAWLYGSTQALPVPVVIVFIGIFLVISLPGTVLAALVGRHYKPPTQLDVASIARPVPQCPATGKTKVVAPVIGFICFLCIAPELWLLNYSFWGTSTYTSYTLLTINTAIFCATIVVFVRSAVYAMLHYENHRWRWPTVIVAASPAAWALVFAFLWYVTGPIKGFYSFVFYALYSPLLVYVVALALGTIGFMSVDRMVRTMYRRIKTD
ncbi:transmembrane 9 superfamily member [Carpediemonas membranifera]|uniref:Transmembrane 9 superfamily member n=1 Tax=Carpediemonas membranifera TaxID=201153 RepID=A0A8J6E2S7_9EUKA|nr:transmembrane 9 superfamily member [Carpediemonas membranifera]|eukprot:KAG9392257.1 transmembrane 9 superfamily member [Carpediemonas membranifera]